MHLEFESTRNEKRVKWCLSVPMPAAAPAHALLSLPSPACCSSQVALPWVPSEEESRGPSRGGLKDQGAELGREWGGETSAALALS